LFRHFALAQDANAFGRSVRETRLPKRVAIDRRAVLEVLVQIADIDDEKVFRPGGVTEAAFRDAAEELHLPAFEEGRRLLGAGAGPLALAAARAGLAVPRAGTAADTLLPPQLVNAVMNGREVHSRFQIADFRFQIAFKSAI